MGHHKLGITGLSVDTGLRVYDALGRASQYFPPLRWFGNYYGRNHHGGYILKLSEAAEIVGRFDQVGLIDCACRRVHQLCDNPVEGTEIVLGTHLEHFSHHADFREVTPAQAVEVLYQCDELGLVHSVMKCENDYYAICNCCQCCCEPRRLKGYGIEDVLVRDNDIMNKIWPSEGPGHGHTHDSYPPESL